MTSMEAWSKKLSDQEIWKIIAYQRNFALRGQVYNPDKDRWEDPEAQQQPVGSPDASI